MDFIIVVEKDTLKRIILPLSKILSIVECDDGDAFFETETLDDCSSTGVYTTVKFADILQMLADKILVK